MRNISIKLNELYGIHHNQILLKWLNEQYLRQGQFKTTSISLLDMEESSAIYAIKQMSQYIPFNAEQLVEHAILLPCLDQKHLDFEIIARVKSSYYQHLLMSSSSVKIDSIDFVFKGDVFEQYGHDRHIFHEKNTKDVNTEATMVYLNGTIVDSKQAFSVALNSLELTAIRESHIEVLFNGVNPYTADEWLDVYKTVLLERLIDEDIFLSISNELSEDAVLAYRAVKDFHSLRYESSSNSRTKVYSSYGKHIATKKFRFSAEEKLSTKRQQAPHLTLVKSQRDSRAIEPENNKASDDIMSDFGTF